MSCDLIIPALNEEANIDSLFDAIDAIPQGIVRNVIIADNSSTDDTPKLAEARGAIVVYEKKRGYGAACLKAIAWIEDQNEPPDMIVFPHAGYSLLGINNRDLKTMKTDLTHTFRMLEFIEDRKIVVSESGITSATDLAKLRQRGVNIVLVGEHLLRQEHPGNALREMLGQNIDGDA